MQKVIVGLSGGVDSAVSAFLLKEQGYNVLGVSFKFWEDKNDFGLSKALYHQRKDSLRIAMHLGIEWEEIDAKTLFFEKVTTAFAADYLKGKTPNPCIGCNPEVKWEMLQKTAQKHEAEWIATGHYAGKMKHNETWLLRKGADLVKDQSYMLWRLHSSQIEKTLFPLAEWKKEQVKQLAQKIGLTVIAKKRESFNCCFLQQNDYRHWLKKHFPEQIIPGDIIDKDSSIIGEHQGIALYTVGEELLLRNIKQRLFVTRIIPEKNILIAAKKEHLFQNQLQLRDCTFYVPEFFVEGAEIALRVRGKEQEHTAVIEKIDHNTLYLKLSTPVFAIAEGQSIVFYKNDCVVGGK